MLSILIVNWNTRDLLRDCLKSILASDTKQKYEVIVVDNCSGDGSAAVVKSEFPEAILIEPGVNTGYAPGNNLAFAAAKGEYLLTLNPDTEIPSGALDAAIIKLELHPECGILAPRLVGPDGETQASVRGFPTLAGIFGDITGLGKTLPALDSYRLTRFDYSRSQIAPQPMGTFLLFRKSDLPDPLKPFDESFPIFFNEVDLLKRMEKPAWYEASIAIKHLGGMSTRQVRRSMIWESHRSLLRYLRKHELHGWRSILVPIATLVILGAAFVRAKGWNAGFRP